MGERKPIDGQHLVISCRIDNTKDGSSTSKCLLDNGSTAYGFIDRSYAQRNGIPILKMARIRALNLADGASTRQKLTHQALVDIDINGHDEQILCYVANLDMYDVILGMPWFETHNPSIDWPTKQITFDSAHCYDNCLHGEAVTVMGQGGKCVTPERGHPRKRADVLRSKHHGIDITTISAQAMMKSMTRQGAETFLLMPRDILEPELEDIRLNALSSKDYEAFMKEKDALSPTQIKQLLPKEFHDFIDVFLQQEADTLPPHRPGKDHEIRLTEGAAPPFRKARPMGREELMAMKKHIEDMCVKGFARPASSPYGAPMLIVRKPGGGLRICVDYRALNALTVKNRYPIPLINETLDRLSKARFFTTLDVIAAFNRVRMKEGDEEKTAFNTRYGQFEYLVMPFGLCNAPGTFQSLINDAIREYLDDFSTAYLDDILVYSQTRDEHVQHVRKILQRMREHKLQLDIRKCRFIAQEVKYLGMFISTEGLRMDPVKVEAITGWQPPRSVRDVQAFLGFANFYRRFVQGFSKLAVPLTNLTKSLGPKGNKSKAPFLWTPECQQAFDTLKQAFTTAPVLAHFDPDRESWVETDASDYVTAATLSQHDDQGVLRPVAFLSSKMSPQETNYEIYDKELLAIVRAFENWRPELMSIKEDEPVRVLSDHKNLEWFMSTKELNRRQARWAEFLSQFNFRISYRPGKQSTKPDSLTRRSQDLPEGTDDARLQHQHQVLLKDKNLTPGMAQAVQLAQVLSTEDSADDTEGDAFNAFDSPPFLMNGRQSEPASDCDEHDTALLPTTPQDEPAVAEELAATEELAVAEEPTVTEDLDLEETIAQAYANDADVREAMRLKIDGERRLPLRLVNRGLKLSMTDMEVRNERLFVFGKLYVPNDAALRDILVKIHHEASGHAGTASTYALLFRSYFWVSMPADTRKRVLACYGCKRKKPFTEKKQGLLRPLPPPHQKWRHLTMDFAEDLPACKRHGRTYRHILVVVDRNSKGRRFAPLASLQVDDVVEAFRRYVIAYDGYPETIICDRGSQWMSRFWHRLMTRRGTRIKTTTAFHPETDGQSENAVKLLKQYLRFCVNYDEDNWVDFLPEAQIVALNHPNESTGLTPFFVDRGHHPRLGIEPPGPLDPAGPSRTLQLSADDLVAKMAAIQKHLQDSLSWAQAKQAEYANRSRQPAPEYRVGDKVFLDARNLQLKTGRTGRLGNKNEGPFEITRVVHNGSAYELRLPESMKTHNVFHPWLLHFDASNAQPEPRDQPVQPEWVQREGDEEPVEEWEVEEIVNSRYFHAALKYKAIYRGHDQWNLRPQWQPWEDFQYCLEKVADYHHRHPTKAGPWPGFTTPEDWLPPEERALQAALLAPGMED